MPDCASSESESPVSKSLLFAKIHNISSTDRHFKMNKSAVFEKFNASVSTSAIQSFEVWVVIQSALLVLIFTFFLNRIICKSKHQHTKVGNRLLPRVQWFRFPVPKYFAAWWTVRKLGERGLLFFKDLQEKYGDIYEISFGFIDATVINDPTVVQKLLTSNNFGYLNKSNFLYKMFLMKEFHGSLFASNRITWQQHRQCLSRGFSYKSLLSYIPAVNVCGQNIVSDLESLQDSQKCDPSNELMDIVRTHVTKMTGQLLTGESWSNKDCDKITERNKWYIEDLLYRLCNPVWLLKQPWQFHPRKFKYEKSTVNLQQVFKNAINNYETEGSVNSPAEFVPLTDRMLAKHFTPEDVIDDFGSMIFAELDSTCTAIEFLLMHLASNPEIQNKCQAEIHRVFDAKIQGSCDLDMNDLCKLKYVERCILESLRLAPSIPAFSRKITAPFQINQNLTLKPGTTVIIPAWVIHRDPRHYPNPERFDPDRFLPENAKKRPIGAYIPFSLGLRNCLGWKLALIQMKVILAWVLRSFEVESPDKLEDICVKYAIKLVPERSFRLSVRKHNLAL